MAERTWWARHAWVAGAWARDVLLTAKDGFWHQVRPGCDEAARGAAEVLEGPVLPGLVNAHSHAFQRAIAGLTERSPPGEADDFWSWRDRMYRVALKISPEQLEAVAHRLYAEMLQGGYTHVCEFHYLHNDVDGRPYADAAEMSNALVRAAARAGIGLTLLPTLYMRSGFGAAGLRDDQRRFASTPDSILRIAQAVRARASATLTAGIALHSLRAVHEAALHEAVSVADASRMPVHIHIAEQHQEVQECLRHHARRPIEWLQEQVRLHERWNLVHATQATAQELESLTETGAAIVLCPSTEANLGDGIFELPVWLRRQGAWSIGSDSHVTRCATEELRLLEYSQRFVLRQRNVAARAAGRESSAAVLFDGALAGGSAAAGLPLGGIAVGQRADLRVIDARAPSLRDVSTEHWLDALVFSSPDAGTARVIVAGEPVAG